MALIAGLVFGELFILLGVLAGAGKVSLLTILLLGFVGEVTHDMIFYFISNSKFGHLIKKRLKLSKKKNKIVELIESISPGHYILPIFVAKFIYGVREAVILYTSHNEKNIKKYIGTVAIADFMYLSILLSISWLAGRGFTRLLIIFRGIERILIFVVIGIVVLWIINKLIVTVLKKFN